MAELKIALVVVGDEILLGQTLDTNSHWIAGRLCASGLRLSSVTVVSDEAGAITNALRQAFSAHAVVIVTGGLGPTHDDITRPVLARMFGVDLSLREELLASISRRYESRDIPLTPAAQSMALFPEDAAPIPNLHGAAPGIHFNRNDKHLFALPGVPVEMRGMMEGYVLPLLEKGRTGAYRQQVFKTVGAGETQLAHAIGSAERFLPVTLAFLPSVENGVTVRLSLTDGGEHTLRRAADEVRSAISQHIFAEDERSLEEIILDMLRQRGMKLAVAESCTGGLVAARLVSVPGSSDVFERGVVSYSNQAKTELLGVPAKMIERFGAVSAEVAAAMATGVRRLAGVEAAVSVTGIAGPSGGSDAKPVGLTFIGCAAGDLELTKRFHFIGDRNSNRQRAALAALATLWKTLQQL